LPEAFSNPPKPSTAYFLPPDSRFLFIDLTRKKREAVIHFL
jgi:hypothetical protein